MINRAEKQRRTAHPEILLLGNFSRDTTLISFPRLRRVFTIDYNLFTLSSHPAPSGPMSDTPSPPVAGFSSVDYFYSKYDSYCGTTEQRSSSAACLFVVYTKAK